MRSTQVLKLARSLTNKEKRYFQQYLEAFGKQKTMAALLFREAVENPKLSEEELKERHADSFGKRYRSYKHELFHELLRFLRLMPSKSTENELYQVLIDVRNLFDRGCVEEAESMIVKGLKQAQESEHELAAVPFMDWQMRIKSVRWLGDMEPDWLEARREACLSILDNHRHLQEVRYRNYRVYLHFMRNGTPRTQEELDYFNRIAEGADARESSSNLEHYFHHQTQFLLGIVNADPGLQVEASNALLLRLDPADPKDHSNLINTLNNKGIALVTAHRFEEIETVVRQLEALKPATLIHETRCFVAINLLKMQRHLKLGEVKEGSQTMDEIFEGWDSHSKRMNSGLKAIFYLIFANHHFLLEEYEKSLDYIRIFLDQPGFQNPQEMDTSARILQLVAHYEMGHSKLINSISRNMLRKFNKRKRPYELEKLVLKIMRHGMLDPERQGNNGEAMRATLEELREISSNQFESPPLNAFDITSWVQSKVEQRRFRDVVRENGQRSGT